MPYFLLSELADKLVTEAIKKLHRTMGDRAPFASRKEIGRAVKSALRSYGIKRRERARMYYGPVRDRVTNEIKSPTLFTSAATI